MINNSIPIQRIKAENNMLSEIVEQFLIFETHKIETVLTSRFTRNELLQFKEQLEIFLGENEIYDKSNLVERQGSGLKKRDKSGPLCVKCGYRKKNNCQICMFELQSSLEQKMLFELCNKKIEFHHRHWLDRNGNHFEQKDKSDSNDVLTVADFYIEGQGFKLCIYTEGYKPDEKKQWQIRKIKILIKN
jgi:hypothetical protein